MRRLTTPGTDRTARGRSATPTGRAARPGWIAAGAAALGDLVLPVACGGCGAPGASWCHRCGAAVALAPGPQRWVPTPTPVGLPPVWTVLPYADPVRTGLVNWKDNGRRDLAEVLAPVLTEALLAVLLRCDDDPVVVPAPSGRANIRRRGDQPLAALARSALRRLPAEVRPRLGPVLRLARAVADQAGLDSQHRVANLEGAMTVPAGLTRQVAGHTCLLVDDVITTGATIAEAARALRVAGAHDVLAVTLAATHRQTHPPLSFPGEPG